MLAQALIFADLENDHGVDPCSHRIPTGLPEIMFGHFVFGDTSVVTGLDLDDGAAVHIGRKTVGTTAVSAQFQPFLRPCRVEIALRDK